MSDHLLSFIFLIPLLGSLIILFLPKKLFVYAYWVALASSFLQLIILVWIMVLFDYASGSIQFQERLAWITDFKIDYYLGIDGISLPFIILAVITGFIAILLSKELQHVSREYYLLILSIISLSTGLFLSLDLFFFLVLFILLFLPGYFIALGRQKELSDISARTYSLTAICGGFIILPVFLGMYYLSSPNTYDIMSISRSVDFSSGFQKISFFFLLIGFGLSMGFFPFHFIARGFFRIMDLPLLVLMSGVVIRIGYYAIIRIGIGALPEGFVFWSVPVAALGILGFFYPVLLSLKEESVKLKINNLIFATQSLPFLGLASIRITTSDFSDLSTGQMGLTGSILSLVGYSLAFSALLILGNNIIREEELSDYREPNPSWLAVPGVTFILVLLGCAGIPGSSVFLGNFLILNSAFQVPELRILSIIAVIGWIGVALIVFSLVRGININKNDPVQDVSVKTKKEIYLSGFFFLFLLFLPGIIPGLFMSLTRETVLDFIKSVILMAGYTLNL